MRTLRARVTVASVGMTWSAPHSALCTGLLGTGSAWCSLHKHPLSPFRRWHWDGGGGSSCSWYHQEHSAASCYSYSSLPYTGKHPAPRTVHLLHRWILTTALWDRHNFSHFTNRNRDWEGFNDLHSSQFANKVQLRDYLAPTSNTWLHSPFSSILFFLSPFLSSYNCCVNLIKDQVMVPMV